MHVYQYVVICWSYLFVFFNVMVKAFVLQQNCRQLPLKSQPVLSRFSCHTSNTLPNLRQPVVTLRLLQESSSSYQTITTLKWSNNDYFDEDIETENVSRSISTKKQQTQHQRKQPKQSSKLTSDASSLLYSNRRRSIIRSVFQLPSLLVLTLWTEQNSIDQQASAKNLPSSTGADISQSGTVDALLPIISLRQSLEDIQVQIFAKDSNSKIKDDVMTMKQRLVAAQNNIIKGKIIPTKENDFKRIFDTYSDTVSYKQKFLDQNAFLVYYTQGFDGPDRPRMESSDTVVNERQTLQFGARNEAWISWEDFLLELDFCIKSNNDDSKESGTGGGDDDDTYDDLKKYVKESIKAVDNYLQLAPSEDVQLAKQRQLS